MHVLKTYILRSSQTNKHGHCRLLVRTYIYVRGLIDHTYLDIFALLRMQKKRENLTFLSIERKVDPAVAKAILA